MVFAQQSRFMVNYEDSKVSCSLADDPDCP